MTTLTFHHTGWRFHPGLLTRLQSLVGRWRARAYERAQLAKLDERDLRDARISRAMQQYEANKPFWRA